MREKAIFVSVIGALAVLAVLAHFSKEKPRQPVAAVPVVETHMTSESQRTGLSDQALAAMKLQDAAHGISAEQRSEAMKNQNLAVSEAASQQ